MIDRNTILDENVGIDLAGHAEENLTIGSSVGKWVAMFPKTAEVFDMLQVDYCCHGGQSLEQACQERSLEVLRVRSLLQRCIAEIDDSTIEDWFHAPLGELCDHIEQTHHAYLKHELPSLSTLIAEVVELHGDEHAELHEIREQYQVWRDEVLAEIAEEVHSLFPAIRSLASSDTLTNDHASAITKMIRDVAAEHRDIGAALGKVRTISGGFAKPRNTCRKFAQMLGLLRHIDANVRQYVHKEEYILFPRADAMTMGH